MRTIFEVLHYATRQSSETYCTRAMLGKRRRYERIDDRTDADAQTAEPSQFEVSAYENPPLKAILLGCFLLALGLAFYLLCYLHHRGHVKQHIKDGSGMGLAILGSLTFLPGAYTTWLAFAAWRGIPGYKYSDIPRVT